MLQFFKQQLTFRQATFSCCRVAKASSSRWNSLACVETNVSRKLFTATYQQVRCYESWFLTNLALTRTMIITKVSWPEGIAKRLYSSSQTVFCPPVYHTQWMLHALSLMLNVKQGSCEHCTNFYSLWLYSTENQNCDLHFNCTRSTH